MRIGIGALIINVSAGKSTGTVSTPAPTNSVAPAITGTQKVGNTLSCSTGTWSGSPTYAYQWKRAGTNISGATASTYALVSADYNTVITCVVTATNAGGSISQVSNSTSAILSASPVNTVAPAITGTETEGNTLTCSTGTWTSQATLSYAYQWKRGGTNISGATSSTYLLAAADVGTVITCSVTATGDGSASQISNSTGTIASGVPVNSVAPVISGTQTAGSTLSSTTGTFSNSPTGYTYQWKRDGVNISGATSSTYVLVEADVTTAITCSVTATNTYGSATTSSNTLNIPAKSVPTFVSKGTRATATTGTLTPVMPAGMQANDIMIAVHESANEAPAAPAGWTLKTSQVAGTAAAIGSVGCTIYWKRHSGSESAPTFAGQTDHSTVNIYAIRGCVTSGDPFSDFNGGTQLSATTSFSGSGPTTVIHNELVFIAVCTGADSSLTKFNTANNMAGTGLTNIVNQEDLSVTSGNGGGLAVWTATRATPGAVTSVTATINSSTEYAYAVLSLKPA